MNTSFFKAHFSSSASFLRRYLDFTATRRLQFVQKAPSEILHGHLQSTEQKSQVANLASRQSWSSMPCPDNLVARKDPSLGYLATGLDVKHPENSLSGGDPQSTAAQLRLYGPKIQIAWEISAKISSELRVMDHLISRTTDYCG